MEKQRPHYDLPTIQADVARLGVSAFTKSAMDGGRALGLNTTDMLQVVSELRRSDFFKSMTTYANHAVWQDVYYPRLSVGVELYVKVTQRPEGPPVISFKRRSE